MNDPEKLDPLFVFGVTFCFVLCMTALCAQIARQEVREELKRERLRDGRRWMNRIIRVVVNETGEKPPPPSGLEPSPPVPETADTKD